MKRFCMVVPVLLCAAAAWSQPDAVPARFTGPKDKLHIYVLVGQSNMSGRAKVEAEDEKLPRNLFLLDASGSWVGATHPFIQYTNVPNAADTRVLKGAGKTGLNLGLAFARRMLDANPGVSLGLVVNSQGGSAIQSWKAGAKSSNYDKTMARIRPIRETGHIKGILWHQGEANQALAVKYLDPLAEVIGQFRKDLGDGQLPFVAGQLAPLPKQKDVIQAFNRALLELPTRVPRTAVVRTDDFLGDDIHFGSAETRKLGLRYAEEMLKLQAP